MAPENHIQNTNFQYVRLANDLENKILLGIYQTGERLPSIRELHNKLGLSISTIYQTYIELEKREIIKAKPKSGYYVRAVKHPDVPKPQLKTLQFKPRQYSAEDLTTEIIKTIQDKNTLQLGCTLVSPELLPLKQFNRAIREISKTDMESIVSYGSTEGEPGLRREIAKRMLRGSAGHIDKENIITTNGCMDALYLCLRAVTKPGDTIIMESPTFFNLLQLVKNMGLYVVEVPTDPIDGIDIDALNKAVKANIITACLTISNFQNPMGGVIPDDKKKKLVEIMHREDIAIIEDDIYGDLHFDDPRPSTLKSFDKDGLVLYCSSFSKTLAPGMRVGWTLPGRFTENVRRQKMNSAIASPVLTQLILADFLQSGSYERHLRKLRRSLKGQVSRSISAITEFFPKGTRISAPKGGFMLWVELPSHLDGIELFHKAREKKISIVPGSICSTSGAYKNCIRLSCGNPWSEKVRKGYKILGSLMYKLSQKHV